MKALSYEIKAYPIGHETAGYIDPEYIGCGIGKRGKAKAIEKAQEMWQTGKYIGIYIDAYNDEEIVDDACIEFH